MISALRFSALLRTSSSEVIFSASSWALRMIRSLSLRASSSIAWRSLTIQRACLSSSGMVWRIWSMMSKAASRSTIAVLPKPGKLRASSTSSSNLSISTSTSIFYYLSFAYDPCILPSRPEYICLTVSSTPSGTSPRTSPPSDAISLTALEERKLCSAEAMMKTVSSSGNIVRLSCACSNSDSKSETALRPFTIACAPRSLAKSTSRPSITSTETLSISAVTFSIRRPLDRRQTRLFAQITSDSNDHVVEDLGSAPDDIEMPRRYRVEATGTHSHDHCQLGPPKYGYERAAVAARYPFLTSCALNRSLATLDRDPSSRREQRA